MPKQGGITPALPLPFQYGRAIRMTATADMILERRRVRRSLTFWRIAAIVAIVVAVIAMLPRTGGSAGTHIARVSISGMILDDPARDKALARLASDDDAVAVIVRIDSPGGTVAASEAIYEGLRAIAEEKPIVTVMNEYAASGGYVSAIASDYIVARGNTLTGSIGVVSEIPNISGLLDILGVEVTRVKSAPLKAEPSITDAPSPAALKAQEALIADMFGWFKGLVAERRSLDGTALDAVTDGRAFTGRQALELGLIDALGDQQTAVDWLAAEHDIDEDLSVIDHRWDKPKVPWPLSDLEDAAATLTGTGRLFNGMPRLYAVIQ